jgi:spermidine/putrescine transport system substrate-binding protein
MERTLTILTWPDYIDPQTLQQFEVEFNVTINLAIVPSAVELVERMQAAGPEVDVLVPPDYAVRELNEQNLLAILDHSRLPNLKHLAPRFRMGRPHDPNPLSAWSKTGEPLDSCIARIWFMNRRTHGQISGI